MSENELSNWLEENNLLYDGKIWGREEALSLDVEYSWNLDETLLTT